MTFSQPGATLLIPDDHPLPAALERTTHLGVGAHQDDLEFMAFHGINICYHSSSEWFTGVTCTNGSGSPRTGGYASCSDADMQRIRRREQDNAARVGNFAAMFQLDFPSAVIKDAVDSRLCDDLLAILKATRPQVVYTHNPADKHDTHLAVLVPLIRALRQLPMDERPKTVLGCEVWRGLDWMQDDAKVALDVSGNEHLAAALNGIFDSQIAGGKRYDLATLGRRRANATFFASHGVDNADMLSYAMDLSPLMRDDSLSIAGLALRHIDAFRADVEEKLRARGGC